jgi:hypothetical protein
MGFRSVLHCFYKYWVRGPRHLVSYGICKRLRMSMSSPCRPDVLENFFFFFFFFQHPFLAYYGATFLLWELSTPFLNFHW